MNRSILCCFAISASVNDRYLRIEYVVFESAEEVSLATAGYPLESPNRGMSRPFRQASGEPSRMAQCRRYSTALFSSAHFASINGPGVSYFLFFFFAAFRAAFFGAFLTGFLPYPGFFPCFLARLAGARGMGCTGRFSPGSSGGSLGSP
jgi:hypothetical protein